MKSSNPNKDVDRTMTDAERRDEEERNLVGKVKSIFKPKSFERMSDIERPAFYTPLNPNQTIKYDEGKAAYDAHHAKEDHHAD